MSKVRDYNNEALQTFLQAWREGLGSRHEWTQQASCRGLSEFFDSDYANREGSTAEQVAMMKKICSECPVFSECLNDTILFSDEYTFRAGMFPKERKALMKKLGTMSWEAKQKVLRGYAPKKQARA